MARAQVQNQIFIYVISLVVISLIMLYGYNALNKLRDQSEKVSYIQLKTDLENEIKKMGYEYGSVEKKVFDVPSDIKKVCFAEHDNNAITQVMVGDAVIWDSIDSGVEKNVFLKKGSVAEESFYIGNIEVEGPPPAMNPFLCFDVASSKIIVRLEGLGKKVKVSEW